MIYLGIGRVDHHPCWIFEGHFEESQLVTKYSKKNHDGTFSVTFFFNQMEYLAEELVTWMSDFVSIGSMLQSLRAKICWNLIWKSPDYYLSGKIFIHLEGKLGTKLSKAPGVLPANYTMYFQIFVTSKFGCQICIPFY